MNKATKGAVLDAALRHVGAKGFTKDALIAGCVDSGLVPAAHGQFGQPRDLALRYARAGNDAILSEPTAERALEKRLKHVLKVKDHWPAAIASTLVSHASASKAASVLSDLGRILHQKDDSLSAQSWTAVYVTSELYALAGNAKSESEAMDFVKNRLEEARSNEPVETLVEVFKAFAGTLADFAQAAPAAAADDDDVVATRARLERQYPNVPIGVVLDSSNNLPKDDEKIWIAVSETTGRVVDVSLPS